MKKFIILLLLALSINQSQAVDLKKIAWTTGATIGIIGSIAIPAFSILREAINKKWPGRFADEIDEDASLKANVAITLGFILLSKYCYDKI